VALGSTQPVI